MNWSLFIMADDKNRIERQVRDKLKSYNKQRAGSVIIVAIFIGILVFFPAAGVTAQPERLSVFCSAVLLLCGTALVLSFRVLSFLFSAAAGISGILLALHQIHLGLFLMLLLINAGTVFISNRTGKAIIRSFAEDNSRINRLAAEATMDSLTKLLNRSGLEQAAEIAWALCKRDKKNAGVILADIDCFKSYNDVLGHLEGDKILKQVAGSIERCFRRQTDILSRIGGDEFLIFLPGVSDHDMLEMAQSFSSSIINLKVKAVSKNTACNFLSVSMGITACVPQPDDTLTDLYRAVDEALYHAKKAGRNCISFHEKIIQTEAPNESLPVGILPASAACRNRSSEKTGKHG